MDLQDIGKKPISADKPAGEDVRYDPDFEQLQGEIDKLSIAATESQGVDWPKVVRLGSTILGEKSKHLLVAVYLCAGLMETEGLDGLASSLRILNDLTENFWPTFFPPIKRMQGRINAIRWWMDRVQSFFGRTEMAPQPAEVLDGLGRGIKDLDRMLAEKVEDSLTLRSLLESINRIPVVAPVAPPPVETPAPTPPSPSDSSANKPASRTQTPVAALSSPPPIGVISDMKDAEKLLDANFKHVSEISGFLMQQSLSNPLSYRLNRLAAWTTLDSLPPATGGQTMIPPPDGEIRSSIEKLISNGLFEDTVNAAESRVPVFLFWLDLNLFTVRAMEMLGPRFQEAREAVCTETALYVWRLPGIENMAFSDGTPFADKETRTWLKTIRVGKQEQPQPASSLSGGVEARVGEVFAKAQALMGEKKSAEAIQLFQDQMRSDDSGRGRLIWRIALSRFLLNIGRPELVQPQVRWILEQIERFKIEDWDPLLALSGFKVVYEGVKDEGREGSEAILKDILDRIARISPVDVLHLLES